jgi:hypothetical protein
MTIEKGIPTIYASIGNREDIDTNQKRAEVIGSVFQSESAQKYHALIKEGFTFDKEAREYVAQLENALREALSPQTLAEQIRELANDPEAMQGRGEIWGDILRLVAKKIAPPSI